jgi:hypothetical protein
MAFSKFLDRITLLPQVLAILIFVVTFPATQVVILRMSKVRKSDWAFTVMLADLFIENNILRHLFFLAFTCQKTRVFLLDSLLVVLKISILASI